MKEFVSQHQCNKFCRQLGLGNVQIPSSETDWVSGPAVESGPSTLPETNGDFDHVLGPVGQPDVLEEPLAIGGRG